MYFRQNISDIFWPHHMSEALDSWEECGGREEKGMNAFFYSLERNECNCTV